MAPELRKRKSRTTLSAPAEKPTAPSKKTSSETKSPKVEKRKANDEASPVAKKKQKAVKDATVTKKKPTKDVDQEEVAPSEPPASKKEKKSGKKSKEDKKKPVEEPEAEEADAGVPSENEEEEVDVDTQALVETLGSDAEESDSTPQISTYKKGQDVGKIPKPKKAAKLANGAAASGKPGVMYLGSIPHGFYEHEIKEYFSQFGEITRLRVVRNKKTGASRHHAFVEFADAEVADIAARTMDSYLLFGHILRAKTVRPEDVHPQLFKGANRRFKAIPWNAMAGRHLERPLGETKWQGKIAKEEQRRAARAEKLKEMMDYEFEAPALKAAEAKQQPEQIEEGNVEAVEAPAVKQIEEAADKANEAVEEAAAPEPVTQKAKKAKKGTKAKKVKA
ncbi:putative RNA-binding protein [Echria macrotheca]|uniref:RNA-binding protein n=1 Tax=Echria macrotheca TaxID=438768 RepID=A0AAJ0B1Q1_9PEZI|nr:putative RNA-binding protein [Echria macrotheca]